MGKVTAVFVFCAASVIVGDAFLEPFASKFLAKKMMLNKHSFGNVHQSAPPPKPQYGALFYGGHFEHYPQPSPPPPPQPSYPAYGPEPSYPAYSPEFTAPSYGPPNFSGYEQPAPAVVKPQPPSPPVGCLQPSNPSPQVDYSAYGIHGGYGFGSYGINGNGGAYGK